MRKTVPHSRPRTARAAAAALAVVLMAMGTGCSAGWDGGAGERAAGAAARPPAKPVPVWNRNPDSIAAVGDSITRGFDACSVLADCPEASWATGNDPAVRSLASRLLGPAGAADRSWNFARTGARMADLPGQLAAAAEQRPELVTVMAGANDACRTSAASMTPVEEFRSDFAKGLGRLRKALPKTQVYVSSVPDLMRLWETGRDSPLGRQIWKLGICPSMLADPEAVDAAAAKRRAAVQARVVAYNTVLREVCGRDPLCRYDGGAVFRYPFTVSQLSRWDWFHPGKDGQARLAELAHRQVTAAGPPR
ncbi:SGNH/GDSL hydrolase family protein [Streptomyces bambusae]|uniref:SGNH/GDSL hydrolase family protein n=1 Tax=Streptomyces bambusae TaxID=1550616 RepID=UPI001CFD8480|nr:SGNH/GDSL hydrolase family protein [Streptomyces bambusae]MCB5164867.1 SGNH/GDSL hydrolase family protein [Streptomyces bambusae]